MHSIVVNKDYGKEVIFFVCVLSLTSSPLPKLHQHLKPPPLIFGLVIVKQAWIKVLVREKTPLSRDSDTCAIIRTSLFVFGGTDGKSNVQGLYNFGMSEPSFCSLNGVFGDSMLLEKSLLVDIPCSAYI